MSSPQIEVVIATDDYAADIERLSKANNFEYEGWDIDWSHIYPSWLVAKSGNEVVGCLQVLPGFPIGRMEFMAIDSDQPLRVRAVAVRQLLLTGLLTLNAQGVEGVAGTIPFELVGYKEVLERMGGMEINEGWVMLARTH